MFTGLVEVLGRVLAPGRDAGPGGRLAVAVPDEPGWRLGLGESVAVNGVCLTVVDAAPGRLAFDLAEETRRVTTLGRLVPDDPVNLERPLRLDARVGGHLVLGHVDGVGTVVERRAAGDGGWLGIRVPGALRPFLIPKGSVAVDGVSLTVATLGEERFDVALIPHTLARTTLGRRAAGDPVNLEMDVIGKYVQGFVERWAPGRRGP